VFVEAYHYHYGHETFKFKVAREEENEGAKPLRSGTKLSESHKFELPRKEK
jgi:hypothetical protein